MANERTRDGEDMTTKLEHNRSVTKEGDEFMQAMPSRAGTTISGITAAAAIALGLVAVSFTSSSAQVTTPPILVEPLTPRSVFTDAVQAQFSIKHGGPAVCPPGLPPGPRPASFFVPTRDCTGWVPNDHPLAGATEVLHVPDLSRAVVARITVQPGAQFPWHTHPGLVMVNVAQGELVYVEAGDCVQRTYPAGTAFLDPGHGHTHTAFNRTSGVTVLYATFFEVPAQGPLTITEGVEAPPGCQAGV
jgi:quercetin dioxygenase-like cupin family protein